MKELVPIANTNICVWRCYESLEGSGFGALKKRASASTVLPQKLPREQSEPLFGSCRGPISDMFSYLSFLLRLF